MAESGTAPKGRPRAPGGGRKRTFDADDVLVRAVDLFWEQGFSNTSVRQLETELGLTASSIYNTYGSKSDLLDAAMDQYLTLMDQVVLSKLRDSDDPLSGLSNFFHQLSIGVDGEHRWGCFIVSLLTENAGRDERVTTRTHNYFDTLRVDFEATLRRASELELLDRGVVGEDLDSWIRTQVDLLLANVLGINSAARGRMGNEVVDSMTRSVQMQIEHWRSG